MKRQPLQERVTAGTTQLVTAGTTQFVTAGTTQLVNAGTTQFGRAMTTAMTTYAQPASFMKLMMTNICWAPEHIYTTSAPIHVKLPRGNRQRDGRSHKLLYSIDKGKGQTRQTCFKSVGLLQKPGRRDQIWSWRLWYVLD